MGICVTLPTKFRHQVLFCLSISLLGKVRSIGVSNFSIKNLETLLAKANVVPATNQVELHPCLPQEDLKKYCDEKGISLTAYSPFGALDILYHGEIPCVLTTSFQGQPGPQNMPLLKDSTIAGIAERTGSNIGQVLVSWAVQRGTAVIPKSEKEERIKQNISVGLPDLPLKYLHHT